MTKSFRRHVYLALNPQGEMTFVSRLLIVIILLSVIAAVAETEEPFRARWAQRFLILEAAFTAIFTAEYVLRIWSAPEGERSRLRYALMPSSLVDLVVVVASLLPMVGTDVMVLRTLRALRMLRLAKLGRFSDALGTLHRALKSRASHLLATLSMAIFFLIVSATCMYWAEGLDQPDRFGSIPRAMWWAAVTMTTVGYGDVVPLSALGKVIAGLTSMGGIILIAIPTGILAASFIDELAREEREQAARDKSQP